MSRGGKTKAREDGPERKCLVTGEVQPKAGLMRFVVGPEGQVVPDVAEKLPGRGIWVTSEREAIDTAAKKKLFSRSAKQQVTVPDNLSDMVETLLAKRVCELLALARKSGDAVAGYEKVKDMLAKEEATALIQACDGSTRGKTKLSTPTGAITSAGSPQVSWAWPSDGKLSYTPP